MVREWDHGVSLTSVDQYLRQVKQIPQLTDEEQAQLLLRAGILPVVGAGGCDREAYYDKI